MPAISLPEVHNVLVFMTAVQFMLHSVQRALSSGHFVGILKLDATHHDKSNSFPVFRWLQFIPTRQITFSHLQL